MPRTYTPVVRFSNTGSAMTVNSIQTVENVIAVSSDHATKADDFSGVVRYRRDWRVGQTQFLFPPVPSRCIPDTIEPLTLGNENRRFSASIIGQGFENGCYVKIDNVVAAANSNVEWIDDSHITVTSSARFLPVEERYVNVTVVNPSLRSGSNDRILRTEFIPTITSVEPSMSLMDGGTTHRVYGSYIKDNAEVVFYLNGVEIFTERPMLGIDQVRGQFAEFVSDNMYAAGRPTGSYSLTIRNPSGLSTTGSLTFLFKHRPPVLVSILPETMNPTRPSQLTIYGKYFFDGIKIIDTHATGSTTFSGSSIAMLTSSDHSNDIIQFIPYAKSVDDFTTSSIVAESAIGERSNEKSLTYVRGAPEIVSIFGDVYGRNTSSGYDLIDTVSNAALTSDQRVLSRLISTGSRLYIFGYDLDVITRVTLYSGSVDESKALYRVSGNEIQSAGQFAGPQGQIIRRYVDITGSKAIPLMFGVSGYAIDIDSKFSASFSVDSFGNPVTSSYRNGVSSSLNSISSYLKSYSYGTPLICEVSSAKGKAYSTTFIQSGSDVQTQHPVLVYRPVIDYISPSYLYPAGGTYAKIAAVSQITIFSATGSQDDFNFGLVRHMFFGTQMVSAYNKRPAFQDVFLSDNIYADATNQTHISRIWTTRPGYDQMRIQQPAVNPTYVNFHTIVLGGIASGNLTYVSGGNMRVAACNRYYPAFSSTYSIQLLAPPSYTSGSAYDTMAGLDEPFGKR